MKFAVEKPFEDMVCALEENLALCVIQYGNDSGYVRAKFHLPASSTVADLYQEVGRLIQCHQDSFDLVLRENEYAVSLNRHKTKTIEMAGFKVGPDTKNTVVVVPSPDPEESKGCGSSGEPAATFGEYEIPAVPPPPPPPLPAPASAGGDFNYLASTSAGGDFGYPEPTVRQEIAYVGLVNQAMTCYLNSLLQALYMTPEFRNAMYNWEFDGSPSEESKSIPYQLQKLFLNLQTSRKSAVETTELTRSFGWDSWEAWQQHDIQELCRVMFDTLEQKFKNTKQADLINRLYEGKMIDYVKCLECSTEKSRDDTFLDIPLPVRPFGSNVAYGSVEEALRAFVQPETLEGNNQYHCETCNKKCDAHKGLKFSKFPYLLTLHLKRFDFDFNTLHRIKLNDKVSFPEKLNLNSFVAHEKESESSSEVTPEETAVKCDDSCTTDSGSALDDEGCQGIEAGSAPNSHLDHRDECQEDDEGIDVEHQHENEKNRQNACEAGPYVYELFSIMIHSGSAAGGHYYAYIKDFKDGEWYCFNDRNVARITYDDIRKTYGGGPIRGYYSGAYSSSTNAYMLMYRQIDKERNASAMTVDEFPEHIKVLHRKLERQKELQEQKELEEQKEADDQKDLYFNLITKKRDFRACKLRVHHRQPNQEGLRETEVFVPKESTVSEALKIIYEKLNLAGVIPIERCRLVSYDKLRGAIEYSFEGNEKDTIEDHCFFLQHKNFLVDTRQENEEFAVHKPGSINTVVIVVDVETEEVSGPFFVKGYFSQTVKEYKEALGKQLKSMPETSGMRALAHVASDRFSNVAMSRILEDEEVGLRREGFYDGVKVYVAATRGSEDVEKSLLLWKLHKVVDRFAHVITLHVSLPEADGETLERLNIPPLDRSQTTTTTNDDRKSDELSSSNRSRGPSPNPRDPSPQPHPDPEDESAGPVGPHSDQSASEDSSLTDSERTIVGDAPGDCLAQLSPNSSPVGSDQNVSFSENEGNECSPKRVEVFGRRFTSRVYRDEEAENWAGSEGEGSARNPNYFFKAVPLAENNLNERMLRVLVDERMSQESFKQCLEPFVGVPVEYFRIYRTFGKPTDFDFSIVSESLEMYKNNEKLNVKFGRALKEGEYNGKVFLLSLNDKEPVKFLFEWVIANGSPVSQVKKEILEEMKRKCAIEIPYDRCRLRKKYWNIPMRPYLDGATFENLIGYWELFVQELPGEEPVTGPNQKLLFVQQVCFSAREAKPLEEIVLDTCSDLEFKEKISEISGIPTEFIDTAVCATPFPCVDGSLAGSNLESDWNSTKLSDGSPVNIYDEGHLILYRDSRNKSKCFLTKDLKLFKERRNRLYSPVKERGLKIYLDATPPRKDESDVD